jgi:hypothetical protein
MPEKKEDEQLVKAQAFLKEYGELVERHQMDFATYPMFVPDGAGGFKIRIQSTPVNLPPKEEAPVESTFMEKE